jgi:hypothetical protein
VDNFVKNPLQNRPEAAPNRGVVGLLKICAEKTPMKTTTCTEKSAFPQGFSASGPAASCAVDFSALVRAGSGLQRPWRVV